MKISKQALPDQALLQVYATRSDCFADCYTSTLKRPINLEAYVTAFYGTRLFRTERVILGAAGFPSTDTNLAALAKGQSDRFAAWRVEALEADQILMCDRSGRTRSWLMIQPEGAGTRLFFGSAVVPKEEGEELGFLFRALLGFHKLYSRALLRAARAALKSK